MRLYNRTYGYKQRPQSPKSDTGREKEVQPLVIQRVGVFAHDRIQVVYKFITATIRDADEDNQIT